MLEQLRQRYLASFRLKIDTLKGALENQDFQALIVQVHQLAGSSGSYGFQDISALCCDIETIGEAQHGINQSMIEKTRELIQLLEHNSLT